MKLTTSVVITTRNRKDDLARTIAVLGKLDPLPDEIIVSADGCTDGTVEFVKSLPNVRLIVNDPPRGSIGSRDTMIRQASGDIILSFDDDSYPVEPDFIQRVCDLFQNNERLAVASFPQFSDEFPDTLGKTDFGPSHFVGSYASSSAAIRRGAYLELGGYTDLFFHVYEEPDFALRCVAAGWQVRYETSLHVRHCYSSVQRNEIRIHHFQARNELWSVMIHCPFPQLVAVGIFRALRQLEYARKHGLQWIAWEPRWWLGFLSGLPSCFTQRKPIPWKKYRQWMKLIRSPIFSEQEWAEKFGT